MCVFLISPVPIAEPLTSELIDTPVFHNLAPRPIKYRVSVPIPNSMAPLIPLCVLSSDLFEQEDLVNPTTRLLVSLSFNSYISSKALKRLFVKLCSPVAMETPRFCGLVFRRSRDNLHQGPQSWERHSTHADGPKYRAALTWVEL